MKNFLITGGSGHLGVPIVAQLLEAGHSVYSLSSRQVILPSGVPDDLLFQSETEIAGPQDIRHGLERLGFTSPNLDGAVFLAGRGSRRAVLDLEPEEFAKGVAEIPTLLYSSVQGVKDFLAPGASLVAVTSLWGHFVPDLDIYLDLGNEPSFELVAAWAAQRQLIRYLASYLAAEGIRLNAVEPGWFPKPRQPLREDYIGGIEMRLPIGRIGNPRDVCGAVEFLLSDSSRYVLGEIIAIDGGYGLR